MAHDYFGHKQRPPRGDNVILDFLKRYRDLLLVIFCVFVSFEGYIIAHKDLD